MKLFELYPILLFVTIMPPHIILLCSIVLYEGNRHADDLGRFWTVNKRNYNTALPRTCSSVDSKVSQRQSVQSTRVFIGSDLL